MADAPPEDLIKAIAEGRALIVCGAGVTQFSTCGTAPGWKELIEKGLAHASPKRGKKPPWVKACQQLLKSDSSNDWLYAADIIQNELGGNTSGRYREFLKSAAGELTCEDSTVIEELDLLARLENRIATTNYDELLIRGLGRPRCLWTETKDAAECLSGDFPAILHLHGHWRDLPSVVFSRRDYERLRNDQNAQFLQHHASFNLSLLFIGCSTFGLADENVGALLQWFGTNWRGLGRTHYALVRKKELNGKWPDAVEPIAYGNKHDELPGYLRMLRPTGPSARATGHKPAPAALALPRSKLKLRGARP